MAILVILFGEAETVNKIQLKEDFHHSTANHDVIQKRQNSRLNENIFPEDASQEIIVLVKDISKQLNRKSGNETDRLNG